MTLLKQTAETAADYDALAKSLHEKESDGVYVIDSGKCAVLNPFDKQTMGVISRGDVFGESQELRVPVSINHHTLRG